MVSGFLMGERPEKQVKRAFRVLINFVNQTKALSLQAFLERNGKERVHS